ncbi:MAG TPA: carboxymuconolactone decarboxylase family protein [Actinophytocola sp.]|jgi:AhpD family alkylhydroperoxidase|nr:carboxymuconolactone decarboxylase family protein [Actinophytocola sp.]
MIPMLVRLAVRRSLNDTRHVKVVKRRHAQGRVADVYRQVERDFGMLAPPTALHSVAPDMLAASWMILRETLLAQGVADRAGKEAVATGVSVANSCPYCEDVHGMTLAAIPGADRSALTEWARGTGTGRGAGLPPCPPEQAPELIGVAVAFHYYNRVVNVFLRDSPFPAHVPESAKPRARRVLGGVLRPAATGGPRPGESLDLLPPAPAPAPAAAAADELAWARPNHTVTDAFARAYAATEAAGTRSVPAGVRDLVRQRLSTWDGRPPGVSRAWAGEAVATLPERERAAGRLALFVALASYQVDDEMVDDLRRTGADDRALVELVSWASMAAARRVGSLLGTAGRSETSPS